MAAAGGSQPLAFGELLAGGVLLTAGITGHSIRDVLAGRSSPIKPLTTDFPTGAAGASSSANAAAPAPGGSKAGLTNPLPGWTQGRIDQGVDYSAPAGTAILSPGAAKVLSVGAPGWPDGVRGGQGDGVLLKLDSGEIVYIYEGLHRLVQAGQRVTAGQKIGVSDGASIEIGFADSSGTPLSHSSYTEGKVTKAGQRMKTWLAALGPGKTRGPSTRHPRAR